MSNNYVDEITSQISLLKRKIAFKNNFIISEQSVKTNLILGMIFLLFFPPLSPLFIGLAFIKFYKNFTKDFMNSDLQFSAILRKFSPALSDKCISTIGYRVEYNELDEHLNLLNTGDIQQKNNPLIVKLNKLFKKTKITDTDIDYEENLIVKKMMEKQKQMLQIPTRRVGVDIDTLKTHLVVLGKTGSGKTEFLRSLLNDIWKIGSGNIFIDAKADSKMLSEVVTQLKRIGRETSLRVLNFLKSESFAETNTVNFFNALPPSKAVDFLFQLADTEAASDGNHQYFQQRGKAMLTPIVYGLTTRKIFNNENFNVERLRQAMNVADLTLLYFLLYGMARDINDIIKENLLLSQLAENIKTNAVDKNFIYIAKICSYFVQNPFDRKIIENVLQTDMINVYRLYRYSKVNIESYLYEIWPPYRKFLPIVAKFVYFYVKAYKEKSFYSLDKNDIDYDTFFEYFEEIKLDCESIRQNNTLDPNSNIQKALFKIKDVFGYDYKLEELKQLIEALTQPKTEGGNIHDVPDDAIQQHSYAQQQWTKVFDFFDKYQNIFGRNYSEIQPYDLVLDNQILYVLFSPKEDAPNTTTIAKTAFTFADLVASKALGGEKISTTMSITNILKSKTVPKPIFIIFGDEYNSYALKGVEVNFLQFRSLNISMILAAQTMSGLQPGKNDKIGMQNIMLNSSKYILQTGDDELFEYLKKIFGKEEVYENDFIKNEEGKLVKTSTVRKTEKDAFRVEKIKQFNKGFGIFLKMNEQNVEDVIFMQSIYRGGQSSEIKINNFVSL